MREGERRRYESTLLCWARQWKIRWNKADKNKTLWDTRGLDRAWYDRKGQDRIGLYRTR